MFRQRGVYKLKQSKEIFLFSFPSWLRKWQLSEAIKTKNISTITSSALGQASANPRRLPEELKMFALENMTKYVEKQISLSKF